MPSPTTDRRVFVCVDVPDLDRGIGFFTAGLSLALGRRFGDAFAELAGASVAIHLLAAPRGSPAHVAGGATRDYGRHWTPVHVDLVTGDLDGAVARATAAGAVLERAVARRTWNAIAGLADPFGHGFDLIEEPGNPRPGAVDVAIDVPDVARAVAFYRDGLGLALRGQPMPGAWARLTAPGTTIHLQAAPERPYTRHWTPVHLDFVTTALEPAVARATRAGGILERPIQAAAWGRMANLADPFGHGVCLVEMGPHGYDALIEEGTP